MPIGCLKPSLTASGPAADTVRGRPISRNGNWMQRFEEVLDRLPGGHVFDGELVVLDDAGRQLGSWRKNTPSRGAMQPIIPAARTMYAQVR
jgi:hypothetical protein